MREIENETNELQISQMQKAEVPDGVYRALYKGFKMFMDNTPWGEKKVVKMSFFLTSGPAKGSTLTFRGMMVREDSSGKWIIGSRSKLGAAIKSINPNGTSINEDFINTPVLVKVTNMVSKRTGENFALISEVLPAPIEDKEVYQQPVQQVRRTVSSASGTPVYQKGEAQPRTSVQQPVSQQQSKPVPQRQATQGRVQAQNPVQQEEQAQPNSNELLEDLTDLGDYGL